MGVMMHDCKHPITGRRCRLHFDTATNKWYTEDGIGIDEKNIERMDDGKGVAGFVVFAVLVAIIAGFAYELFFK